MAEQPIDAPLDIRRTVEHSIRLSIDMLFVAKGYGCMQDADELARNIIDSLIIEGIWGVSVDSSGPSRQ